MFHNLKQLFIKKMLKLWLYVIILFIFYVYFYEKYLKLFYFNKVQLPRSSIYGNNFHIYFVLLYFFTVLIIVIAKRRDSQKER